MGKYSYFKAAFDRAETAQSFTHLPDGEHVVRLNAPHCENDTNGTCIIWPLVARVGENIVNAQFRQYLTEKTYPFIKRNLKAILGEGFDLFDIDFLDEWLAWMSGAYVVCEVSRSISGEKKYVNYVFTGLHKPIEKEYPSTKAQTSFNNSSDFAEVEDDELPF